MKLHPKRCNLATHRTAGPARTASCARGDACWGRWTTGRKTSAPGPRSSSPPCCSLPGARRCYGATTRAGSWSSSCTSSAYSLFVHSFHACRDRVVRLPPCSLYGAATLRPPPLGPGRGLTLPCGWNNAGLLTCRATRHQGGGGVAGWARGLHGAAFASGVGFVCAGRRAVGVYGRGA